MAYYTDFELSIITTTENPGDNIIEKILIELRTIAATNISYFFIEDGSIKGYGTWYDHDEDCAELSKKFPEIIFGLHGEGEEKNDLWNGYYKNGLCQIARAKLTVQYPAFNPSIWMTVQEAQNKDSLEENNNNA